MSRQGDMLCQSCHRFTTAVLLCGDCRRLVRPAQDRILSAGIKLVSAFEHAGPAKKLIHHLKYRGLTPYAHFVASILEPRLPRLPVVPVPRAMSRHIHYGVDPARLLADALADRLETEVIPALARPVHARRRAGGDHQTDVKPLVLRSAPAGPVLVIDDVVTTGSTLESAIAALGSETVVGAAAANTVPQVFESGADDQ